MSYMYKTRWWYRHEEEEEEEKRGSVVSGVCMENLLDGLGLGSVSAGGGDFYAAVDGDHLGKDVEDRL